LGVIASYKIMNKFQLRHKILEAIYILPENPTNKEHPSWIFDHELKKRIRGTFTDYSFYNELEYLYRKKEIRMTAYEDGSYNLHSYKEGDQSYLDNYYLDKSRDEKRNTTQHNLKVIAWIVGITLGILSFSLNIFRTLQDLYSGPLLKYRIEQLEDNMPKEEKNQHPPIQYNIPDKKDSLNTP
jgi:hypothetical protein